MDFADANKIPTSSADLGVTGHLLSARAESSESSNSESSNSESSNSEGDSTTNFPESLEWLFCASLAIAMYCMVIIGILHKGLDSKNLMRIPKASLITF